MQFCELLLLHSLRKPINQTMGSSTDSGFFRLVTNRTAYAAILIFLIFDKRQICAIEIDQPVSDAKDSLTDADSAYDSFLRISSRKIAESGDDFFLNASLSMISRLNLVTNDESINDPSVDCDPTAKNNPKFKRYFDGMSTIYQGEARKTCLVQHMKCGWPAVPAVGKKLPLLVVSVGLEGAGHHLWTEILKGPVFDCVWTNARHYRRDVADGVPRLTAEELHEGQQAFSHI